MRVTHSPRIKLFQSFEIVGSTTNLLSMLEHRTKPKVYSLVLIISSLKKVLTQAMAALLNTGHNEPHIPNEARQMTGKLI